VKARLLVGALGLALAAPAAAHASPRAAPLHASPVPAATATRRQPQPLRVTRGERLLVVAPHPDDEALGAAGLMQRVLARGGRVWVVLVTAGDGYVEAVAHDTGELLPRPIQYVAYGKRRVAESRAAMHRLGGQRIHVAVLGFPDGGLRALLRLHWQRRHPERSPTTEAIDAPYQQAVEPDVPYDGSDLRRELVRILKKTNPTIVALPDPLDKHPDHRATGLFTLLALQDWVRSQAPVREPLPELLAYLVHWPDWPPVIDGQAAANAPLLLPAALPGRGLKRVVLVLTPAQAATKRAALAYYATQQEVMPDFLASFVRRTEPFTVFTRRDLRRIRQLMQRHPRHTRSPGRRR
jgi:LmbE family N-acetylglucosaminyl deacetylase